jgi:hypothetical protein
MKLHVNVMRQNSYSCRTSSASSPIQGLGRWPVPITMNSAFVLTNAKPRIVLTWRMRHI